MQSLTTSRNSGHVSARRGVTLIEVLISMMIMLIGVTMVISLFPASTLMTLKASRLTSATILSQNVKALIQLNPDIVFDPDGHPGEDIDGNGTLDPDEDVNGNGVLDPGEDVNGNGIWDPDEDLNGNGILDAVNEHHGTNYVVDPIGYFLHLTEVDGLQSSFGGLRRFGGFAVPASLNPLGSADQKRALNQLARTLATQGDGWTTLYDSGSEGSLTSIAVGVNVVGLTLPASADLTDIPYSHHPNFGVPGVASTPLIPDPENTRIVVFSEDERISQALPLTQITGTAVYWSEDTDADGSTNGDLNGNGTFDVRALPAEFKDATGAYNVSRAVIQTRRANDYSWMLTVRLRADGVARSVDIVTRYVNSGDTSDEQTYFATFLANSPYVGLYLPGNESPNITAGRFIFNVTAAKWYRIASVRERPAAGWLGSELSSTSIHPNYDYLIELDQSIKGVDARGEDARDGNLDGEKVIWTDGTQFGRAMFPTGIIDVFPVGYLVPQ